MVDRKIVRKVAELARLHLNENELEKFSRDLESILKAFRDLDKIPAKGVEPSFQPVPVKNVTRRDSVEESLSQEDALKNTRNREGGYFKGPRAA